MMRPARHVNAAGSIRTSQTPRWFESVLFVLLMSGPPKFRDRDPFASLAGAIDLVVVIHIAVWTCGALWVLARVYPMVARRGLIPPVYPVQALAALFIGALTLSIPDSPGVLLSTFTVGQFAVMLGFSWVFTDRYGASACLRHLFAGVTILALVTVVALIVAPDLVTDAPVLAIDTRVRGDKIADTAAIAVLGLVLCLSSIPALRGPLFWGALLLFGVLLAGSRTRSAYAAFFVFLAIGFVRGKGLRVRELFVPLAAVGFIVVSLDAFSSTVHYLVRERESIETMSDRIPLWEHLTQVVMRESPLTGMGYYAASRVVATEYNAFLGNAHSVFFEVLVGGGILGAVLYVALCVVLLNVALRLMWAAIGRPAVVAAVGLFFVALLMGISSPSALHPGPLGFAFWSSTAILPALWSEVARARTAGQWRYVRRSGSPIDLTARAALKSRTQ
jgi:O-antigen ligase